MCAAACTGYVYKLIRVFGRVSFFLRFIHLFVARASLHVIVCVCVQCRVHAHTQTVIHSKSVEAEWAKHTPHTPHTIQMQHIYRYGFQFIFFRTAYSVSRIYILYALYTQHTHTIHTNPYVNRHRANNLGLRTLTSNIVMLSLSSSLFLHTNGTM